MRGKSQCRGSAWGEKAQMETIFDHDPTPEELDLIFNIRSSEDMESYRRMMAGDADTQLGEIARLYLHRGQPDRAAQYLASIDDPSYRWTLEMAYLAPDLLAPES
ncbi:MAG: hypothetical protein WHS86_15930 [Desulfosoma sp.]